MNAAMINVGLMRENRFPIRNATAHTYACVTGVAKGRSGQRQRKWQSARVLRYSPIILISTRLRRPPSNSP
jgi:hypothetical protein